MMSARTETIGGVVVVSLLLIAYLACGSFVAWLFGLEGGLTYTLFVLAWPVPLGVAFLLLWFGLWIALSIIRALGGAYD